MKTREQVDPELHILRSITRRLDGRDRTDFETARFSLFKAFEEQNAERARAWILAVRAGLFALTEEHTALRQLGENALTTIEKAVEA